MNVPQDNPLCPGWQAIISPSAVAVIFPTQRHYWDRLANACGAVDGRTAIEVAVDGLCEAIKRSLLQQLADVDSEQAVGGGR